MLLQCPKGPLSFKESAPERGLVCAGMLANLQTNKQEHLSRRPRSLHSYGWHQLFGSLQGLHRLCREPRPQRLPSARGPSATRGSEPRCEAWSLPWALRCPARGGNRCGPGDLAYSAGFECPGPWSPAPEAAARVPELLLAMCPTTPPIAPA